MLKMSKNLGLGLIAGAFVTVGLVAVTSGGPSWGYEGELGPENWGSLSEANIMCSQGRVQSPFDIKADVSAGLAPLNFAYGQAPVKVVNNSHTLQVDIPAGHIVEIDGEIYNLLQFHFHTPSEYTVLGRRFPMAMHMVHSTDDGKLGVVGVMLEIGEAHPTIQQLWDVAPTEQGYGEAKDKTFEIQTLLPANGDYYRFMGSLTTPPCSEGINWHVMTTPITVSADQVAAFEAIFPMNARPLQPENGRLVVGSDS